jgi:hypothetical protein
MIQFQRELWLDPRLVVLQVDAMVISTASSEVCFGNADDLFVSVEQL